jgi:CHAT domain-containing protein
MTRKDAKTLLATKGLFSDLSGYLEKIVNGQPYENPIYWAAFTVNGLYYFFNSVDRND